MFARLVRIAADRPDDVLSFRDTTTLVNVAKGFENLAGRARATLALRIKDSRELTLVKLAKRIGVSKTRAEQLVSLAKRQPLSPPLDGLRKEA